MVGLGSDTRRFQHLAPEKKNQNYDNEDVKDNGSEANL